MPKYKIAIPKYDLYGFTTAESARQAVIFMLKRMERERPWLKGNVYYNKYAGNSDDFAQLIVE